jgi:hypothetical protein
MTRMRKPLMAAAAVLAGATMAAAGEARPHATASFTFDKITYVVLKQGSIQGIVADGRRHAGGKSRVVASLTGLTAGTHYAVAGSKRPCSEQATTATNAYALDLGVADGSGAFSEGAGAGAATVTSLRVLSSDGSGSFEQVVCVAIDNTIADGPQAIMASVFRKGIQGVVGGTQKSKGDKTHLTISLRGLTAGSDYAVVGSRRRCAKHATKASNAYTVKLENATISSFSQASRKTPATRSVRIFERPPSGSPKQVACSVVDNMDVFQR